MGSELLLSIYMNLHTINLMYCKRNFAGLIFCVWQHKNIFAGC